MLYPEHVGGREKYVVRLAEEWGSRHQIGIVCYTRRYDWSEFQGNVRIHAVRRLPTPSLISQIMFVITTVLVTLVYRYQIVYVNSFTTPELAGLINKLITRKPYVVAVHNPSELFSSRLPRFSFYVKKTILLNASHIIAVSRELMRLLLQYAFVRRDKVSYIPPGVDQELFKYPGGTNAAETRSESTAPLIITSRRLVREKGIDVLLEAIKALKDDGFLVRCVIIGTGPELHSLAQLSEKLGIKSQVTFTGLITDEELKKLISSADCCVIPSRREGTPVALFEYMALGKPVVATQVGGISDILPNKELIMPPNDSTALASGIKMLLQNEAFATKVGVENRETATQYSWSRIADKIFGVFRTVLSPH
jgi:glycosyltransferase involved in cell wall biosynthesis